MEEHSSPTSKFPVFMMTSSNGNMFRVTGFCAENSSVTAGNSPVAGEFPSHRPVSFDVFFDLRLNKRLNKQSRRRWFETPSRSLLRHCNVWCRIVIQWFGRLWDLSAFNASLLSNFELVKRVIFFLCVCACVCVWGGGGGGGGGINYILHSAAVIVCGVRSSIN